MSTKTHFRLFLASPGDVEEERDAVEEVAKDISLEHPHIHIDVIRWEDYDAPNSGRQQGVILENTQFKEIDLFVAVFWARYGTPTGKINPKTGKEYLSGTEEEFEAARKLYAEGRLARGPMVCFCTRPGGCKNSADVEQYKKVLEFKDRLIREHQALYGEFDSVEDFKKKFRKHLGYVTNGLRKTEISSYTATEVFQKTEIPFIYIPRRTEWNNERYLYKTCNRGNEVKEFEKSFTSNLNDFPGRPQVYLIRGKDDECHDSLVDRLYAKVIKKESETKWGHILDKKVFWQYGEDLEYFKKRLIKSIFEQFNLTCDGPLTANALCDLLSLESRRMIVIRNEIRLTSERFACARDLIELFDWYINSFWADLKINDFTPQFIVFLNLIYPSMYPGDWLKFNELKSHFGKKRVISQLKKFFPPEKRDGCGWMFEDLQPISSDDVMAWLSENTNYHVAERKELIASIFITDRRKCMADVEDALKKKCIRNF